MASTAGLGSASSGRPVAGRIAALLLAGALLVLPLLANGYVVLSITAVYIQIIGVFGLNLLTGNTGLISLGFSAFLAVGAYANAIGQLDLGLPAVVAIPASGLVAAALGIVIGIPSLRLRGLYLAITTLALAIIVNVAIVEGGDLTRGSEGLNVPGLTLLGLDVKDLVPFHYACLAAAAFFLWTTLNIERSHLGRAFAAIRESEIAAASSGIPVVRTKLVAFAISSFYIGVAGAFFGHFVGYLNVDNFNTAIGIEALAMIIAGGLGSAWGSILGVVVLTALAEALRFLVGADGWLAGLLPTVGSALEIRGVVFGAAIILFLRFQPHGVLGLARSAIARLGPALQPHHPPEETP